MKSWLKKCLRIWLGVDVKRWGVRGKICMCKRVGKRTGLGSKWVELIRGIVPCRWRSGIRCVFRFWLGVGDGWAGWGEAGWSLFKQYLARYLHEQSDWSLSNGKMTRESSPLCCMLSFRWDIGRYEIFFFRSLGERSEQKCFFESVPTRLRSIDVMKDWSWLGCWWSTYFCDVIAMSRDVKWG